MTVLTEKSFEKDLKKIHNNSLDKKVAACIENILGSKSISEIKNIKDLRL
ncbi:MAG: hypothetical protein ABI594_17160 [Ginsengibacter sp.]